MSQEKTQKHFENHENLVPGLIAIDVDTKNGDERQELIRSAAEAAQGRHANRSFLQEIFFDEDLVDRVGQIVDFIVVDDPVQAADAATESDERVTASPVHKLGFHWHLVYSAIEHVDKPGFDLPALPPGNRDQIIAVVDTGITGPETLPDWMGSSIVAGQDDLEQLADKQSVSHGTFVSSLLRQVAPTHVVSMARAAGLGDGETRKKGHPEPFPTTEFHVAGAIQRLIERHRGGGGVDALHLAVGGPTAARQTTVTLQKAIDRWMDRFPKAPVFAAAGNSPHAEEIYPAAFRHVRGVAAAGKSGPIVWDDADNEVVPPPRPWVDDVAPGAHLIGLGGRGPTDTISWSGSSFATSVATALYVNGGPVEAQAGVSYWPNREMRFGDVPGLRFVT